jgi:hemerythrin superfamily protein
MNATDLLMNQHREIARRLSELLKSEDALLRMSLALEVSSMLEIHMTIEESFFYPAYRQVAGSKQAGCLLLEGFEEHHIVDLMLADLPKADPSAERFDAKMRVLNGILIRHWGEEEREIFPEAQKRLGQERLEVLGAQMGIRVSHLST